MCISLDVAQCALYMYGVKSLAEQLHAAMTAKGWSIPRLLKESGLKCDRTSLQRKLRGKQVLDAEEIQALVNVLEVNVVAIPDGEAGAA